MSLSLDMTASVALHCLCYRVLVTQSLISAITTATTTATTAAATADRGAFIDQSQSMNLFVEEPNYSRLTSMHFYGWRSGLKTGMYYLRTRPAASAT
eukprot:4166-Heterococcus_DN1.PRE.2